MYLIQNIDTIKYIMHICLIVKLSYQKDYLDVENSLKISYEEELSLLVKIKKIKSPRLLSSLIVALISFYSYSILLLLFHFLFYFYYYYYISSLLELNIL